MEITVAQTENFTEIMNFYDSLIDELQNTSYDIGWKKDVYPTSDLIQTSTDHQTLYIGTEKGKVVAAMILNHECNDGYHTCHWQMDASQLEVTVINVLGVHPKCKGKGYAKQLINYAINVAKVNNQKAIRLDVLPHNTPAVKLYEKIGFQYIQTLRMFYEDTGWTEFSLYEYPL